MKPDITPTYMQNIRPLEIADTVNVPVPPTTKNIIAMLLTLNYGNSIYIFVV